MKPIKYHDLSYSAYERIKELILNDELKPGEQIRQEKIAEELGVSRTPLHKAFQMLENEYLVESIPRKGIFVKEIKINQIVDALECRSALESIAVRRVAKNHTSKEFENLKSIIEPFFNIPTNEIDIKAYQRADQEFHNRILELSGNEIIMNIDIIGNILTRTYIKGLIRRPEETINEHRDIILAIENRDEDLAEMLTRQHVYKSQIILDKQNK